jgi:hypothetical protein
MEPAASYAFDGMNVIIKAIRRSATDSESMQNLLLLIYIKELQG